MTQPAAKILANDTRTADLLCEQIATAQASLAAAAELLGQLSVGGEDGELPPLDHSDAVAELQTARRAVRHVARIVESHADILDELAGDQPGEASCVLCGCTENAACPGGCRWVPNMLGVDVCSDCVEQLAQAVAADQIVINRADFAGYIDSFLGKLGFAAPETIPARVEQLRDTLLGLVRLDADEPTDQEALHGACADEAAHLEPPPAFTAALGSSRLAQEGGQHA
ncbi:MAG TPA: hypothetical protein VNO23_07520 [Candidatus Binatia bacterium]|nr:hypothetical protein [Candidatus Binatia bacterium]